GDGATDTVTVNGTNRGDTVQISGSGSNFTVSGLHATVNVQGSEGANDNLVVHTLDGNDVIDASGLAAGVVNLTSDGGAGNDRITGSDGVDRLIGGDGNDQIEGGRGNDVMFGGAGNDVFAWDPGDGSDLIEGQGGHDTLQFEGANISENMDLSANGSRVRLFRDIGNITMDLNGIEQVDIDALGGADTITVGDLSGTDVTQVNIDLAGTPGSGTGDGQADTLIVNGTAQSDTIQIAGSATSYKVAGLPAEVTVQGSEGANDQLVVNALGGDDVVNASTLPAGVVQLTVDGGAGNDVILGSRGADMLLGGDGDDFIDGNQGDDVALLGAGDDVFQWDPGDGSDTVEGQDGFDRLLFNGANVNENIDISANGSRVRFFRDVASVTMDLNNVEAIDFNALGGADNIVVNDVSGTDLVEVNIDLASPAGSGTGDGAADTVSVSGTAGADLITVTGSAGNVTISGPAVTVNITGSEGDRDKLTVNGLGGDDVIDASGLQAGVIGLTIDGGAGADLLIGSQGDDLVIGGRGGDGALLGGGGGTFVWNPGAGNGTLAGQDGCR